MEYCPHPPGSGAGMTCAIYKEIHKQEFQKHINSVNPAIQFFDTIVKPEVDGTLSITVYRKLPTMTSTYSGTVTMPSQQSLVLSTPFPTGPKQYVAILSFSTRRRLTSGMQYHNANTPNGLWTRWREGLIVILVRLLIGLTTRALQVPSLLPKEVKTKGHIVIPYTQGLCESIKKISRMYGIQIHFKGSNTIRNLLVSPKDKDLMVRKSGAIYWFQYGDLSCDDEYMGETSKTFGKRYKEHLQDPSPIHQHSNHTGHPTSHNNFQIIGREGGA